MSAVSLYENKKITGLMKSNLKKIHQSKIRPEQVMIDLTNLLKEKYTIIREDNELIIKPDKRKNLDLVEKEVIAVTKSLLQGLDIDFIFRISKGSSEIVLKQKRTQ